MMSSTPCVVASTLHLPSSTNMHVNSQSFIVSTDNSVSFLAKQAYLVTVNRLNYNVVRRQNRLMEG